MQLERTARAVITGVLERRRPDLIPLLKVGNPPREKVRLLLGVIGEELAAFGFDEKSAPTDYGALLEDIIDQVNRIGFE